MCACVQKGRSQVSFLAAPPSLPKCVLHLTSTENTHTHKTSKKKKKMDANQQRWSPALRINALRTHSKNFRIGASLSSFDEVFFFAPPFFLLSLFLRLKTAFLGGVWEKVGWNSENSGMDESIVMEANCVSYIWNECGVRWDAERRGDGLVGRGRVFLCWKESWNRFRLVTDETGKGGTFNCLLYSGMVCVASNEWLQWRDAKQHYMLRFECAEDCKLFTDVLGRCVPISVQRSSRAVEARLLAGQQEAPQQVGKADGVVVVRPPSYDVAVTLISPRPSVKGTDGGGDNDTSEDTDEAAEEVVPQVSVVSPATAVPISATPITAPVAAVAPSSSPAAPLSPKVPSSPVDSPVLQNKNTSKKKKIFRKKGKGYLSKRLSLQNPRFSGMDPDSEGEADDESDVIVQRPGSIRLLSSDRLPVSAAPAKGLSGDRLPKAAPPPRPPSPVIPGSPKVPSSPTTVPALQAAPPSSKGSPTTTTAAAAAAHAAAERKILLATKKKKKKSVLRKKKRPSLPGSLESDHLATNPWAASEKKKPTMVPLLQKLAAEGAVRDENGSIQLVQVPVSAGPTPRGGLDPVDEMARALVSLNDDEQPADVMPMAESDDEDEERLFSLPPSEQVTEDIIAATLSSDEALAIASGVFDERSLRFYCALAQYRAQSSPVQQRAIAMGILETFIIPKAPYELSISPPVRHGLVSVHGLLKSFYAGEYQTGTAPRAAPDLFERAAAEVRSQVREQLDEQLREENKSADFKKRVATALRHQKSVLISTDDYRTKEDLLVLSQVRLKVGVQDAPGTLRFSVPKPQDEEAVKAHIEDALAQWMDSGQKTLRKIITLSYSTHQSAMTRNVSMLRSLARIDDSIEAWSTLEEQKRKARPRLPTTLTGAPAIPLEPKVGAKSSPAFGRKGVRNASRDSTRDRGPSIADMDTAGLKFSDKELRPSVDSKVPEMHSSEESSEFVDINLDGERVIERFVMKSNHPTAAATAPVVAPGSPSLAARPPPGVVIQDDEDDEEESTDKTDDEEESNHDAEEREAIEALRALLASTAAK